MGFWEILVTIAGGIVVILGAIGGIAKGLKNAKKTTKEMLEREEFVKELPSILENLITKVDEVKDCVGNLEAKVEILDTQFLKYRISDTYHSRQLIIDVPYDLLLSASQCGDLYIAKGGNHETLAQIKIINEEIERRQKVRKDG